MNGYIIATLEKRSKTALANYKEENKELQRLLFENVKLRQHVNDLIDIVQYCDLTQDQEEKLHAAHATLDS
jgi:hypothetical protein